MNNAAEIYTARIPKERKMQNKNVFLLRQETTPKVNENLKKLFAYISMKIVVTCVVCMFLALNAVATFNNFSTEKSNEACKLIIDLGNPQFIEKEHGTLISFEGCSQLLSPEKPVVPIYRKTFIFPAGAKVSMRAEPIKVKKAENMHLVSSYIPAPPGYKIKTSSYEKDAIYPEKWYEFRTMGGIKNGEHVIIAQLILYPVRYDRGDIFYADKFNIKISYKPSTGLFDADEYDLLIICPNKYKYGIKWYEELLPFVEHKEKHGIKTKLVSLDQAISGTYFPVKGRDDAEKLKYFIKNAIEQWGIEYVLFAGGRKPGIKESWYVPVRYSEVFWAEEHRYTSDLYFADIYDGNYNFSSWDTDGNGAYSEWKTVGNLIDDVDLYPDVYIGRLPARNILELKTMINKIIEYENSISNKKIVLVGGDNFENEGIEGEIVCNITAEYLPGYEIEKVYASQMDVNPENIKNALGNGATFMHFHGHGSPISWSTHKPNGFDKWEKGIDVLDLPLFFNEEYPIVVLGGCHTAMFNISLTNFPWTHGFPSPADLSSWFMKKIKGGAIASLGYTCFPVATPGEEGDLDGDGINEPDCAESGYGYMQLNFFYAYGMEGMQYLGECWGYTVANYVEHFKYPYKRWHLHTMQGFVLLGDPTLKIGGYS